MTSWCQVEVHSRAAEQQLSMHVSWFVRNKVNKTNNTQSSAIAKRPTQHFISWNVVLLLYKWCKQITWQPEEQFQWLPHFDPQIYSYMHCKFYHEGTECWKTKIHIIFGLKCNAINSWYNLALLSVLQNCWLKGLDIQSVANHLSNLYRFVCRSLANSSESDNWTQNCVCMCVCTSTTSIMSLLVRLSCGSLYSVYLSNTRSISVLAYWNNLLEPLKMIRAISQSQRTLSSYAFFIRPNLRFVNVTYIQQKRTPNCSANKR